MGSFVFSAPGFSAQPIQNGVRTLNTPANVTASAATGPATTLTSDVWTVSLINTGTLDNAASLALQAQINGSTYMPVLINGTAKTWTGTQINAGVIETLQIKAQAVRFVLTPGTTTGSNGVIHRILD